MVLLSAGREGLPRASGSVLYALPGERGGIRTEIITRAGVEGSSGSSGGLGWVGVASRDESGIEPGEWWLCWRSGLLTSASVWDRYAGRTGGGCGMSGRTVDGSGGVGS